MCQLTFRHVTGLTQWKPAGFIAIHIHLRSMVDARSPIRVVSPLGKRSPEEASSQPQRVRVAPRVSYLDLKPPAPRRHLPARTQPTSTQPFNPTQRPISSITQEIYLQTDLSLYRYEVCCFAAMIVGVGLYPYPPTRGRTEH